MPITFGEKIKVGVFRGGPSDEHELSLGTGASLLKHISEKYEPHDILISKDGLWNFNGISSNTNAILSRIDVAVNAIHGKYGEDGTLQKILKAYSVPHTGSLAFPSMMSLNKYLAKKVFESSEIKVPKYILARNDKNAKETALYVFRSFTMPVILKPISTGSSIGVVVARDFDSLWLALYELFKFYETVLIEEFIEGMQATCGVIENFRGEKLYSLMPLQIFLSGECDYFDYKNRDSAKYMCPSRNFSVDTKKEIQEVAKKAHNVLDLRHYSRSDFIVHPKRGVYLLEVNALPDMSENSPFVRSLKEVGGNISDFIDHIINLALN